MFVWRFFCFWIVLLGIQSVGAQPTNWRNDESYYLSPSNYISAENPYYWKTRPIPDYWQQDVHYKILCNLQPEFDKIDGVETLTYRNNSPDRLEVLYFHLYQNAYKEGSYMDKLYKQQGKPLDFGENARGTEIHNVMHEGRAVAFSIDNTLMKVYLNYALDPGEKTDIDIDFTTYFSGGDADRRMKTIKEKVRSPQGFTYEVTHYDVVHWYPRVAVYDHKFKWCVDQHLGHEFYGDFGSFDVHINLPAYYLLEATGVLQNETEALPDELKKRIDLSNFKDKKYGEVADELLPYDNNRGKRWVFHATNVHDFAFTADPTYRRMVVKLGNIDCVAMARERKAARWQDAAEYCAKFVQVYNNDIGRYAYPKMVVADADDGMEYPMLTLDGGESPDYYSLFAHEIGHNWFYGMVGNNETYRAFLDEGFTQFLTVWAMDKVVGKNDPMMQKYARINGKMSNRYAEAYGPYIKAAIHDDDGVLNTHSDDFGGHGSSPEYGQVYTKTATMLYNLKYVLGEETFLRAMKYYFNKWKFRHPYPEDFRQAMTEATGTDLNWFFDQWLDTDKKIDYKVKSVRPLPNKQTAITFQRKGSMKMPLDFTVVSKEGKFDYHVPVGLYEKNDSSVKVLPRWESRGNLNPQYTVIVPYRVRNVFIDPQHLLADLNLLNNSRRPPVKIRPELAPKTEIYGNWEYYKVSLRPSLWWNGFSGMAAGVSISGNYLKEFHNFTANLWYNTGLLPTPTAFDHLRRYKNQYQPFSYRFHYRHLLPALSKSTYLEAGSRWLDGLQYHHLKLDYKIPKGAYNAKAYNRMYAEYRLLYRQDSAMLDYLLYANNWEVNKVNAAVLVGFEHKYVMKDGWGMLDLLLRTSAFGSQSVYSYLHTSLRNALHIGKFDLNTRVFGRYGTGSLPLESALYLAGGSPEEMQQNSIFRARGFFPNDWVLTQDERTGHAHFAGGLNLRGYAGTIPKNTDGTAAWYGSSGGAVNAELDFQRLIPLRPGGLTGMIANFRTYFFYDGGILGRSTPAPNTFIDPTDWGNYMQDAGTGLALNLGNSLIGNKNLTVRADFPFWVSHPSGGQANFAFRWILGLNKTF